MLRDQEKVVAWEAEQGSMLLGLVVAIFLILLVLGIAAPKVAKELRREREVEAMHRGNQYVRAIQLFYRKIGHYPGSLEQLEKTNNIRFLRQRYLDPFTGKADWRLIKQGEAKTTVKGFFGKPLAGLAPGLGSAAGLASGGGLARGRRGLGLALGLARGMGRRREVRLDRLRRLRRRDRLGRVHLDRRRDRARLGRRRGRVRLGRRGRVGVHSGGVRGVRLAVVRPVRVSRVAGLRDRLVVGRQVWGVARAQAARGPGRRGQDRRVRVSASRGIRLLGEARRLLGWGCRSRGTRLWC